MTKLSEDECSSKDGKKDENDGTVTNDPNHPLLKVRYNANNNILFQQYIWQSKSL